LVAETNRVNDD